MTSALPTTARALTIIRDEHRSLAAVLKAIQYLVHQAASDSRRLNTRLVAMSLDYIEKHLDRLHHTKEDEFLFPVLRVRDPDSVPFLDSLERQHRTGQGLTTKLRQALHELESQARTLVSFEELLDEYAEFQWFHMSQEESIVLTAAERCLQTSDWDLIDAAFAATPDPLGDGEARQSFREMFRRLAATLPEPVGVGLALAAG